MTQTEEKPGEIRVVSTQMFKLKDKPTRQFQAINLQKQFNFIPETIIIEKIRGANNTLVVRAVLTPEQMKLEDKRIKSIKRIKRIK